MSAPRKNAFVSCISWKFAPIDPISKTKTLAKLNSPTSVAPVSYKTKK